MMGTYLPPGYKLLISLVKSVIWPDYIHGAESLLLSDKQIDAHLKMLSAEGWDRLFKQATEQGLLAIVWDALQKRSSKAGAVWENPCQGIPRPLRIGWELSVRHIEEVYRLQRQVLKELAEIFNKEGLQVMLLKGLGLASLYPRPEHRESGDLDIYLYGGFEKGNKLIEDLGIKVEYDGKKHSKFYYKGIPIENHRNFLNVDYTKVDKVLEEHLLQILEEQKSRTEGSDDNSYAKELTEMEIDGITVMIPSVDFQFLFLVRHMIRHFMSTRIVLRHLYDFGIFLTKYANQIDFSRLELILKETDQYVLYKDFIDIAHIYLGMPELEREGGSMVQRQLLAQRIMRDVLENPVNPKYLNKVAAMWMPVRKYYGVIRFFRSKWKYDLTGKDAFRNNFWGAIRNVF